MNGHRKLVDKCCKNHRKIKMKIKGYKNGALKKINK